uniref:Protein kinase domain-containing protein n=1 Tax=Denticeps clupeoides TaxID=299321 RepID=A0AAY4BRS7_9TELE
MYILTAALSSHYYHMLNGSSGFVFKAVKNLTGQMAAVKVIDLNIKTPKKEVEFMQNTKHRNITNLIEIYLCKDLLYICMEHCNGGTLWDLCYETGSLTELEIAYITKQCLQALHYMHGRGYMHRDIKLENIFLTSTGEVKIGDFGAIDRMENLPDEVTRAPEVSKVVECGSYDVKCDIWSLGISLLELAECMSLVTYKPDESNPVQVRHNDVLIKRILTWCLHLILFLILSHATPRVCNSDRYDRHLPLPNPAA